MLSHEGLTQRPSIVLLPGETDSADVRLSFVEAAARFPLGIKHPG